MRLKTEMTTSITEASVCAYKWLQRAMGGSHSDWNNDRTAYISRLVFLSLQHDNWLERVEEVSLYYSKRERSVANMANFVQFIGVEHTHGEQGNSLIFSIVSLMLIHLALEGHINLRYGHQHHLPSTPKMFKWFYDRGLVAESIAHVYMASSPARTKYFKDELPRKYATYFDELDERKRSTRQRVGMNMVEAITHSRIKSLDSVTVDTLAAYYKVNSEAVAYYLSQGDRSNTASTVTYTLYMDMLDAANGTTIKADYERLMATGNLTVKFDASALKKGKELIKITHSQGALRKLTCDHLDLRNLEVDTVVREVNLLNIGDHTFSVNEDRSAFRPENMSNDSFWIKTQRDFINHNGEKGTKKVRSTRLSLFNSYLFDYLPCFFYKHPDSGLKHPSSPSEFLSFVFVSQSMTLAASHFGDKPIAVYPVSLLDYVYTITEEKAVAQGYTKTNSGRDTIATIQRYFDFIIAKFSSIPQCKIDTNPISDFDKDRRKGYSYKKSVKELIELDYWVLLRMYLIEVSKAALRNAEDVVLHGEVNKTSFKVDKTIKWLEHKIHIDTFDASALQDFSIQDWKVPVRFTAYQGLLTLTILAWSGLRSSNVRWLDVRSYAQYCPEEYSDDEFVSLLINTDKTRTEPYTSEIPGFLMRLLDRAARLRMKVDRDGFNEAIPYQGESSSKWSNIKPLLQETKTNGDIFKKNFLLFVLSEFERTLWEHNVKTKTEGVSPFYFESSVYALPLYANQNNFRKTRNSVHAEHDYSATLRNTQTGEVNKFTPIKKAVIWTPHSLRTTFDSICSVLADPETVGSVATGQKPETVGYYSKSTPEQAARIKAIQNKNGLEKQFHPDILADEGKVVSIASISDVQLNKNEFMAKHSQGDHYGYHSLSTIKVSGLKSPIETLTQASANEIALNRTHICPFNNECPREVILALAGEKCCAMCPYAIISEAHAVAISAELKRLGDICADLTRKIKNDKTLLESEVKYLKIDRNLIIKSISGWVARHNFLSKKINSEAYYLGVKDDMVLTHISGSSEGKNLIKRLIETDGVSTMTSPKLEREAMKLNRRLMTLLNKDPAALEALEEHSVSDSEIAVQMIKTICNLNDISVRKLTEILENPQRMAAEVKWVSAL